MKPTRSGCNTPDDVEAAFYAAFRRCDRSAMRDVWADDEVICVHPGSHAIVGYEAVVRSWAHIFSNAGLPDIQVKVIKRVLHGPLAVHVVEEQIATGQTSYALVLASNIYRENEEGWFMLEHHASVIQTQAPKQVLQ